MSQKFRSPKLGFSLLGIGLISGSLIIPPTQLLATTSNVLVIPDSSDNSVSSPVEPQPVRTIQRTAPSNAPTPIQPKSTVKLAAPKILNQEARQSSTQLVTPENHRTTRATLAPQKLQTGKNQYIDTRDYNQGVSAYTPPSRVVVTERKNNCQTVSQNGQLSSGQCAVTANVKPRRTITRAVPSTNLVAASSPRAYRNVQPIRHTARRFTSDTVVRIAAPRVNGVPLNLSPIPPRTTAIHTVALNSGQGTLNIALEPMPQYQRATQMSPTAATLPQARRTDLMFPLAIPAPITSAFGWRLHPIKKHQAMHSGTDIGAPLGTPVLASYTGEVAVADWTGGYGLLVILRHLNGTQESRYAHLSEIYVRPGDQVEQGTVIGRVGSTGLSTGPHLHYEWRHLTAQGWVAVDAGLHLEYALENLVQAMQLAQVTEQVDNPRNRNIQ